MSRGYQSRCALIQICISCCHLRGPLWIECDLFQISLPYAYLTMDVCSYQYEQWYWLYMPKNLWVNHSTRLWCVCNWTLFYSLPREIHLHKVGKTKNPNRIQINCSSPLVVSSNFLTVQPWLSYAYIKTISWFYISTLVTSPMLVYIPADGDHWFPLCCVIINSHILF